jgi:hypothetical protein
VGAVCVHHVDLEVGVVTVADEEDLLPSGDQLGTESMAVLFVKRVRPGLGTPTALLGELVDLAERIVPPRPRSQRLSASSEKQLDRPHISPAGLALKQLDQV